MLRVAQFITLLLHFGISIIAIVLGIFKFMEQAYSMKFLLIFDVNLLSFIYINQIYWLVLVNSLKKYRKLHSKSILGGINTLTSEINDIPSHPIIKSLGPYKIIRKEIHLFEIKCIIFIVSIYTIHTILLGFIIYSQYGENCWSIYNETNKQQLQYCIKILVIKKVGFVQYQFGLKFFYTFPKDSFIWY